MTDAPGFRDRERDRRYP